MYFFITFASKIRLNEKIFTLALICGSLMCGGFVVDAKKTTKKTKARTAATSSVRQDADGYPS